MRQTEAELLSLKNEQGVVSVSHAKQALLERQNELRRAYQEREREIAGAQARIAMIESQIGAAPPAGNEQEAEAPSTPDAAQREIQLPTRDTPDSAPRNGTQIQHAEAYRRVLRLKEEVASAEAQQRVLRLQEDEAVETIAKLNVSESKIVPLERQRAIQDDAYRRFAEALDAAKNQLARAPDQLTNIAVVEPASMPMIASNEDVMKKAMLAGVIGLGICGGLALLLELIAAIRA